MESAYQTCFSVGSTISETDWDAFADVLGASDDTIRVDPSAYSTKLIVEHVEIHLPEFTADPMPHNCGYYPQLESCSLRNPIEIGVK